MHYPFELRKAIQAAGLLLRVHERQQMEYIRLLKLLYITDRETIRDTGQPIIGAKVVALKKGPLHGRVYDLVKGQDEESGEWNRFFRTVGVEIELLTDPGIEALCRYEVRKLNEIHDRYQDVDTWDLVEETHEFTEWKKHYPNPDEDTSRPIPFEDILAAVGRADDLGAIRAELNETLRMERLFG